MFIFALQYQTLDTRHPWLAANAVKRHGYFDRKNLSWYFSELIGIFVRQRNRLKSEKQQNVNINNKIFMILLEKVGENTIKEENYEIRIF